MTNYEDIIKAGKLQANSARTLNAELINYSEKALSIEMAFNLNEDFCNPAGNIQGGFICAMLDECLGPVLFYSLDKGQFAPTLEMNTQFINAAKPGAFIGKAKVTSKGKRVCFLEGELIQDEQVIAKATALAIVK